MKKLFVFGLINLVLSACSTTGAGYMQQEELLKQLKTDQAPIIVDVRSTGEFNSGHVPGAIHIPFWTAFSTDKMNVYAKDQKIVVYCAHGPRAGVAKLAFSLAGFKDINYLAGHMTAWTKAGLSVEKGQ